MTSTDKSAAERDALIDLIEDHLYGVYHCSRVWTAWGYGTMSQSDFSEARGSELAPDLADAILAARACNPPADPGAVAKRLEFAYREGFNDAATFKDVETAWKLSTVAVLAAPSVPSTPAAEVAQPVAEIDAREQEIIARFLERTGQYVTNDASRESAIAEAVRKALPPAREMEMKSVRDVLLERQRQIRVEGWTPAHDDEHKNGELAVAAALYALRRKADPVLWVTSGCRPGWAANFLEDVEAWVKPCDPRRSLVKAGALIFAEIERLDRQAASGNDKDADGGQVGVQK